MHYSTLSPLTSPSVKRCFYLQNSNNISKRPGPHISSFFWTEATYNLWTFIIISYRPVCGPIFWRAELESYPIPYMLWSSWSITFCMSNYQHFHKTWHDYDVLKIFLPEANEGYLVMHWTCFPGSPENSHQQIGDLSLWYHLHIHQ